MLGVLYLVQISSARLDSQISSASVDIQVSRCGVTVGGGAEVGGACMEMEHDLQHPAQNTAQCTMGK